MVFKIFNLSIGTRLIIFQDKLCQSAFFKLFVVFGQLRQVTVVPLQIIILAHGSRAVGSAVGRNPISFVVPCHRVTAASGLGGFSNSDDPNGYLLGIKRWLLAHEGSSEYAWQQTTLL